MTETLQPSQLCKQGQSAYQRGDYAEAAQLFEAAAQGYRAAGDEVNAAETNNNLSVALLQTGQAQAALDAALGTESIFAEIDDRLRQGMALGNQAAALQELGRPDEALERYQQAAEALEQAGDRQMLPHVLEAISAIRMRKGQALESLFAMQDSMGKIENPTAKQRLMKFLTQVPFRFLK